MRNIIPMTFKHHELYARCQLRLNCQAVQAAAIGWTSEAADLLQQHSAWRHLHRTQTDHSLVALVSSQHALKLPSLRMCLCPRSHVLPASAGVALNVEYRYLAAATRLVPCKLHAWIAL